VANKVFPSVNDVYGSGSAGDGKNLSESNITDVIKTLTSDKNFVHSGFQVPATDPDLTIEVLGGQAVINGYWVTVGLPENITLTASSTNYVYLKLTKDGSGNVTAASYEDNTTGTPPADSVLVFTAETSASAITSTSSDLSPGLNYGGVWTPELSDASVSVTSAGQTYSSQSGIWYATGDLIYASCYLAMSSIGTLSGNAYIHNLPFKHMSNVATPVGIILPTNISVTAGTALAAGMASNSDVIILYALDSASGKSNLTCAEITGSGILNFHFQYRKA